MRRRSTEIDWGPPDDPRRWRRLRPEDAAVWSGFLEAASPAVERAAFDVLVGTGLPAPAGSDPATERMYGELSRQKLDVVFERRGRVFAAELKPRCGRDALGQAYFGCWLLIESYPALAMAEPCVIAWSAQAGLERLLGEFGIALHLVQSDEDLVV